jgi:hypothetical protein
MGQRHQIYLKVLNPVKMDNFDFKGAQLKRAKKMFGNGKYTVLAFHHQWLYGHSAAANILNVLHITDPESMSYTNNPFNNTYNTYEMNLDAYIKAVTRLICIQTNKLHPRGIGFEGFSFLNEEDPDMRLDYTLGDNNDGITIIDTITRKYCMMNISTYGDGDDELGYSAYDLPSLTPVSAMDYMKAYYGETVETINTYWTDGKGKLQIDELIQNNIKDNSEINVEILKNTKGVLTSKELNKLFKDMQLELKIK